MSDEIRNLINEARYAQRLCERTARLYRRLQSFGTFFTVVGLAGVMTALGAAAPAWVPTVGAVLAASFTALLVAVRPADKAAANEADVKRYAALQTQLVGMTDIEAAKAFAKAQEGDAAEIEPLRDVAYNDVVSEIGRSDAKVALSKQQKLLAAIA